LLDPSCPVHIRLAKRGFCARAYQEPFFSVALVCERRPRLNSSGCARGHDGVRATSTGARCHCWAEDVAAWRARRKNPVDPNGSTEKRNSAIVCELLEIHQLKNARRSYDAYNLNVARFCGTRGPQGPQNEKARGHKHRAQ